ncbi:alanine--tRNA ligase [Mesoterricola silvestris]|uniref:Alanine--tRNA ligase n=1 Tax=Mesoterricola silvestris TaxID=2927979 RepID=A0AA48GVD9_9BACT|nr:alanine--tRNA ligase [Mesoterricola silvestris]BDU74762.1 alanine--tRNA ligase [Mesoterricola silvestris]
MKTSELRQRFLDYFASRGHRVVASSSVVGPADDPTVMWTNAGMVQFKDLFLGKEKRDYTRAATSQKCLRAGGKHNDLDQVGFTARHHTFFEMLGNFSFGDYFKADAIAFAWELVTGPRDKGCLGLDPARLWVSVFEGADGIPADEEARALWAKAGVPPDHILAFGKKDNFWQMGDTGPCGPCSEIHYDRGPQYAGDDLPNGEGDRVMEIWNLVFMQYDRDAQGNLKPLPRPSIDTGMGLERVASILQGVDSNYEIDLFQPIFEAIWKRAKVDPAQRAETTNRTASQVIADHIRAATFMVFDGVVPSNEGRGYVLRKIIRRALRFGRKLGIEGRFFAELCPSVFAAMGDAYPELEAELSRISKTLAREENQFSLTLTTGLKQLESLDTASGSIPGTEIFKLYDTFGFPVDLVEDWCRERGLACDLEGFNAALREQKAKGRAAMKVHDIRLGGDLAALADLRATAFLGYEVTEAQAKVMALFDAGSRRVKELTGTGFVLLDHTPFYAQSGGQVGDTGVLRAEGVTCTVTDTTAPAPRRHLHHVAVSGSRALREGETVLASVDAERRARIRAHHTATHLLHAALRDVLGTHVKQAGSVVDPERLRFDFNHFAPLEPDQVLEIERLVNEQTLGAYRTTSQVMPIEEALAAGAMALFGEKYGETVRVVSVPGFSRELCGGTHVANTGEIGLVKIVSEGAVAAGVRRLEAVAGAAALHRLQEDEHLLGALARQVNTPREALGGVIAAKEARIHELERELKETRLKAASSGGAAEQVEQIGGRTVVTLSVEGIDGPALREMMDQVRTRHRSAVIALASKLAEDKLAILVSVSLDLVASADAGALLKAMAPFVDGRGGGKKELAQGGGSKPQGLPEAFAALRAALG